MSEVSTEIHGMTVNDYLWCEDCQEFVDWWKFKDLEGAGHEGHKIRNVTLEELKECVADCEQEIEYCTDCLEYLDQEGAKERHKRHNTVVESCLTENFLFGSFKHEPLSSEIAYQQK